MKDLIKMGLLAMGFVMLGTYSLMADSGVEAATRREVGSFLDARRVTLSSTTGTALFPASTKRPDGTCRAMGGYVIWVGTVSATVNGTSHTNITEGFPVYSSETFKLDGSLSGVVYGTADTGVSSVDVRCLDGKVQ